MDLFSFLERYKKAKASPVVKLWKIIYESSLQLTDTTKKEMSELWKLKNISPAEEKTIWLAMLSEFIYCHLSILDRIAFSELGNQGRQDLMDEIVFTLQYSLVESVFNGWDEKRKDNLKNHFSDGYIESQQRYYKAKELLDKKEPFSGNGTLSILGREIAKINDSSFNPEIIMRTMELAGVSFSQINFNKLVIDFKNDKAVNELPKGWRKVDDNEVLPKGATVKMIFGNVKITDAPTKEEIFNENVVRLDNLINPKTKQDATKEVKRQALLQHLLFTALRYVLFTALSLAFVFFIFFLYYNFIMWMADESIILKNHIGIFWFIFILVMGGFALYYLAVDLFRLTAIALMLFICKISPSIKYATFLISLLVIVNLFLSIRLVWTLPNHYTGLMAIIITSFLLGFGGLLSYGSSYKKQNL